MKQFVFTLTTGRSGTRYLAELLQRNLADAECHHEIWGWDRFGIDAPDVSHMTLFNSRGNVEPVRAFWRAKLGRIADTPNTRYSHRTRLAGRLDEVFAGPRLNERIARSCRAAARVAMHRRHANRSA